MSKARRWVIIVLSLAVLVMIGINMAEKDDTAQVVVNNNDPTYRPFRGLRSRYLPRLIRIKSRHGP